MDLHATYDSLIEELKKQRKEVDNEIKTLTSSLLAKKLVFDNQIRQLEKGKQDLQNPTAVKKTRQKRAVATK